LSNRLAAFGRRYLASLVDGVVTSLLAAVIAAVLGVVCTFVLAYVAAGSMGPGGALSDESAVAFATVGGLCLLVSALTVVGLYALYFVVQIGKWGQTPGKRLAGIRVVGPEGTAPGMRRALMREVVGKVLSSSALYAGFIWPVWDSQGQAWHDKIAGTYVVPARGLHG
jgi:uncharacterized RDD family membrane protein YckC